MLTLISVSYSNYKVLVTVGTIRQYHEDTGNSTWSGFEDRLYWLLRGLDLEIVLGADALETYLSRTLLPARGGG